MNTEPFDELAWPPQPKAGRPQQHSTPPIASTLDLPSGATESGAWHDDFLILGSRLREIWGDALEIDEETPAYLFSHADGVTISVTCPVGAGRSESIRISSPVLTIPADARGIFEFALRENAELPLARLSFNEGQLVADHELPFVGGGIDALRASIEAVAWAVRVLRPELAAAYAAA